MGNARSPGQMEMNSARRQYWAVTVSLEPAVGEIVALILRRAGALGIQEIDDHRELRLIAYFATPVSAAFIERECHRALRLAEFPPSALFSVKVEPLVERDWLQAWKRGYRPFAVGRRFLIAPSWESPPAAGDRLLITIDPGMAFGTGTHETTRQCLLALERYWGGRSMLDVGTGTGILAIAAAKLSPPARIVAVDIDPEACRVARENFAANGVAGRIELIIGSIDRMRRETFEMVMANLTTSTIQRLMPDLVDRVEPGGYLVLSGILDEEESQMRRLILESALKLIECDRTGEWRTFIARRPSSSA